MDDRQPRLQADSEWDEMEDAIEQEFRDAPKLAPSARVAELNRRAIGRVVHCPSSYSEGGWG